LYRLVLVLRYLRKRKITIFPIAGVALGVMALVVVLSVMEGFDTDLRDRIRGIMPDLSIEFSDVRGFEPTDSRQLDEIVRRLEAVSEIRAVSPYVAGLALAKITLPAPDGSPYQDVLTMYVNYTGFDFDRQNKVVDLDKYLQYDKNPFAGYNPGEPNAQPVFVAGARLAGRKYEGMKTSEPDWGKIDRGTVMRLTTLSWDFNPQPISGTVVDVVKSGIWDMDAHIVYMPLGYARRFSGAGANSLTGIGVALKDYNEKTVASAKAHIEQTLADVIPSTYYHVSSWEESRRTFLTAVAMERRIMAFILFFFLVIAGFSISAILIMIVLEKIRDIGILLAMGSSQSGIAQIFLTYGVTIGFIGAMIGLALGVLFVENLNSIEAFIYNLTGWEPFPPDIYDLPEIPRILNWWTNLYIVLTAIVVSFGASVIPAVRAAWLNPVEAIRYE
jgi:lipoprotein-releasing system permease protein